MKCPMLFNRDYSIVDCIHKFCAWWNDDAKSCAILQLSKDLYRMEDQLRQSLANK